MDRAVPDRNLALELVRVTESAATFAARWIGRGDKNAAGAAVGGAAPGELAVEERDLIKRLAEFPGVAAEATERRAPHAIPLYAIRVADDFHRFYHEHRVVGSEAEAFRLGVCRATQLVIARCLDLIGVEAPDRM